MPLDRADLRRWKHVLDYHKDKYGRDKAFAYAFQEYWRWYVMNKTDGMSKEELRKELEEK